MTRNTDFLIVGENAAANKLAKAQELGVTTLTEQEFDDMLRLYLRRITTKRKIIGVKNFYQSVDITDPNLNRRSWGRMEDVSIKDGDYTCIVWHHFRKGKHTDGTTYSDKRIGIIGIYLDGNVPPPKIMEKIGFVAVYCRIAGFFQNIPGCDYDAEGAFFSKFTHGDVGLIDEGFYSFASYGNGNYPVFAHKKDGEIDALEIRFRERH